MSARIWDIATGQTSGPEVSVEGTHDSEQDQDEPEEEEDHDQTEEAGANDSADPTCLSQPQFSAERRPSVIALTSSLPIFQAKGPRNWQTISERMPRMKTVTD